jgi:hypothetical protein
MTDDVVGGLIKQSNKSTIRFKDLGPLYTRSQGQCSTQIKHSYWCKSWDQPQGLYTTSQGWNRKRSFQSASSY